MILPPAVLTKSGFQGGATKPSDGEQGGVEEKGIK